MEWCHCLLDILQYLFIRLYLRSWSEFFANGNASRISDLSQPFQSLHGKFLISGSQKPIWAYHRIISSIGRINCYIAPRGRCQDSRSKGEVVTRVICLRDGGRYGQEFKLRPIGCKLGQIGQCRITQLASIGLWKFLPALRILSVSSISSTEKFN